MKMRIRMKISVHGPRAWGPTEDSAFEDRASVGTQALRLQPKALRKFERNFKKLVAGAGFEPAAFRL